MNRSTLHRYWLACAIALCATLALSAGDLFAQQDDDDDVEQPVASDIGPADVAPPKVPVPAGPAPSAVPAPVPYQSHGMYPISQGQSRWNPQPYRPPPTMVPISSYGRYGGWNPQLVYQPSGAGRMVPISSPPPPYPPIPYRDPNLVFTPSGGAYCTNCWQPTIGQQPVPQQTVLQETVEALPGPRDALERRSISQLAWGARRVLGTLYQNCDALRMDNLVQHDFKQGGLNDRINSAEIQTGLELLKHSPFEFFKPSEVASTTAYVSQTAPAAQCRDLRCKPPVFYVGYKPRMSYSTDGKLNLDALTSVRNPNSSSANQCGLYAIDCSGFMSASCAAAGMRIRRASRGGAGDYAIAAGDYANLGSRSDDCFDKAVFTRNESIRSGDIFGIAPAAVNEEFGHSLMVESVGPDPWGIRNITSAADCRPGPIRYQKFDFTVLQSGAAFNRLAAARANANQLLEQAGDAMRGMFVQMAIDACIAQTTGRAVAAERLAAGSKSKRLYAFVRHSGVKVAGCYEPKGPADMGADAKCLDACTDARRGAPQAAYGTDGQEGAADD